MKTITAAACLIPQVMSIGAGQSLVAISRFGEEAAQVDGKLNAPGDPRSSGQYVASDELQEAL